MIKMFYYLSCEFSKVAFNTRCISPHILTKIYHLLPSFKAIHRNYSPSPIHVS